MLQVYDTLTRQKRKFQPQVASEVSFYQCGPTVYSRQHIGNLVSAVRGDFIRRTLMYLGYQVNYTRNITDVGHLSGENAGDADAGEDKMAKGAHAEQTTPEAIAAKYTQLYHQDLSALNVIQPTNETVATAYVYQMAEMVQQLIDKGYAYANKLGIYFDVAQFPDYNKLNRQKLEKNRVGSGHGSVLDSEKKNPYDFALWFFKTGEHAQALQTWEWQFSGIEQATLAGFPGWHIECSAMARSTLGETIDIHMGGIEHIPVHHTNEIAQSEAANETTFANYWLHHELLEVDGGKMSKSLGNVYSLDELRERGFDPLDYRYFLLQAHYRSKQNFTWKALEAAQAGRQRLQGKVVELFRQISQGSEPLPRSQEHRFSDKFREALNDDFNVPQALAVVWDLLKQDLPAEVILTTILDFDQVLGLRLAEVQNPRTAWEDLSVEAKKLLQQRQEARQQRNWEESDNLREKLRVEFGLEVKDTDRGQEFEPPSTLQ